MQRSRRRSSSEGRVIEDRIVVGSAIVALVHADLAPIASGIASQGDRPVRSVARRHPTPPDSLYSEYQVC